MKAVEQTTITGKILNTKAAQLLAMRKQARMINQSLGRQFEALDRLQSAELGRRGKENPTRTVWQLMDCCGRHRSGTGFMEKMYINTVCCLRAAKDQDPKISLCTT